MSDKQDNIILKVRNLKTWFPVKSGIFSRTVGWVKAVNDVSFDVPAGKTLGLVGESGCGKTTVGRTILRLIPAKGGKVEFEGKDIFSLNNRELRHVRRDMQIIFQDPYSSLNPRMTVANIVGESLTAHGVAKGQERGRIVAEMLEKSGLSAKYANRYPHEFSGGQRQRLGIARALALNPKLVICDEPVSALDVSIQSQIVNLLQDLQEELGLTYIFIAHDLAVVKHISDFVAVMYLGRIMEYAPSSDLYKTPLHPYTRALISAIPEPDPNPKKKRIILQGEVPSPSNPPSGCPFNTRCPYAEDRCREKDITLVEASKNHLTACWKVREKGI